MDTHIEELEKKIYAAQQAAAQAGEEKVQAVEIRDTTLSEYLEACYNPVSIISQSK